MRVGALLRPDVCRVAKSGDESQIAILRLEISGAGDRRRNGSFSSVRWLGPD